MNCRDPNHESLSRCTDFGRNRVSDAANVAHVVPRSKIVPEFLHHHDERIKSVLDDDGSVERAGRNPGEIARGPDFDIDLTPLGILVRDIIYPDLSASDTRCRSHGTRDYGGGTKTCFQGINRFLHIHCKWGDRYIYQALSLPQPHSISTSSINHTKKTFNCNRRSQTSLSQSINNLFTNQTIKWLDFSAAAETETATAASLEGNHPTS